MTKYNKTHYNQCCCLHRTRAAESDVTKYNKTHYNQCCCLHRTRAAESDVTKYNKTLYNQCCCLHRTRAAESDVTKYNKTLYNQCCCLHWMQRDMTNPDSKLLPRSIYDVLTQSSNALQRSLCLVQRRQTLGSFTSTKDKCMSSTENHLL